MRLKHRIIEHLRFRSFPILALALLMAIPAIPVRAQTTESGEAVYKRLQAVRADGAELFKKLNAAASGTDFSKAASRVLDGNLRALKSGAPDAAEGEVLYLLRTTKEGTIYIVALPGDPAAVKKGSGTPYDDLAEKVKNRMVFQVQSAAVVVEGKTYLTARLTAIPEQKLLDRLFRIFIILMLFFVMVGMGLTLRVKDFAMIALKPRAMIVGPICQFGLLPFIAFLLSKWAGFDQAYPFIFVGILLVSTSPGGVTSNLMTYWGKGDLALSVSMTAFSTILSLFFTPFLLTFYASNIPEVSIPLGQVVASIVVLVILPLAVGMSVRHKWEDFALRSEKFFSALGVFALLFLIITGVFNNLDKFSDTSRYGLKFYAVIFSLTLSAMVFSALIAKVLRVSNFQTRAISLETGLQNAALAMTIALLLQDRMGDFHSSMFAASGLFGLWMYLAGVIMILVFPKVLPIDHHFQVKDAAK